MQFFDPSSFGFTQPALESPQDDSICGLDLPVSLGVFDRGEMMFGVELGDEVLKILIGELCPIVCDERLWYFEPSKYISLVETEDVV